jgi:uncharacterized protein (DUF2252 family)
VDIVEATRRYERWLGALLPLDAADVAAKHRAMRQAPFLLLRATFYRWSQIWRTLGGEERRRAPVLGIGDLHVENFGTWRDADGRLIWGINDFDEATPVPWTADLARLATSATMAVDAGHLSLSRRLAAEAIVAGYVDGWAAGGRPFVLEEKHGWLRKLATSKLRDPVVFWRRMDGLPAARAVDPEARRLILAALTALAPLPLPVSGVASSSVSSSVSSGVSSEVSPGLFSRVRFLRRRAGLGSLGRPRVVGLASWDGGFVAREAKALVTSAWTWAAGGRARAVHYSAAVSRAVRAPDPALSVSAGWVIRRLAPHCARIELADLIDGRDEQRLLYAMGFETANIHVGTVEARVRPAVRRELSRLRPRRLRELAALFSKQLEKDWRQWRAATAPTPAARSPRR